MILLSEPDTLILLADEVAQTVDRYVRPPENSAEAGGILIGSYRGPHLDIVACTVPMRGDVRGRYLFDRRDEGHDRAAKDAWKRSGNVLTYVGEWHTHPEEFPTPSSLDRGAWAGVMREYRDDPLLFLIVGERGKWCGLGRRGILSPARIIEDVVGDPGHDRARTGFARLSAPIRSAFCGLHDRVSQPTKVSTGRRFWSSPRSGRFKV